MPVKAKKTTTVKKAKKAKKLAVKRTAKKSVVKKSRAKKTPGAHDDVANLRNQSRVIEQIDHSRIDCGQ
jgi:hypothetical protein